MRAQNTQMFVKCKAFTGFPEQEWDVIVTPEGVVKVFDSTANTYTTCHALTEEQQIKIREEAKRLHCPQRGRLMRGASVVTELLSNPGRIVTDNVIDAYIGKRRSSVHISTQENEFWRRRDTDRFQKWEDMLTSGKSYMVGADVPMADFLRTHSSRMVPWMQLAWHWCDLHPERALVITAHRFEWYVSKRGEFVEFGLPHHDKGGERHWVSRDGKTKVLINVD